METGRSFFTMCKNKKEQMFEKDLKNKIECDMLMTEKTNTCSMRVEKKE